MVSIACLKFAFAQPDVGFRLVVAACHSGLINYSGLQAFAVQGARVLLTAIT